MSQSHQDLVYIAILNPPMDAPKLSEDNSCLADSDLNYVGDGVLSGAFVKRQNPQRIQEFLPDQADQINEDQGSYSGEPMLHPKVIPIGQTTRTQNLPKMNQRLFFIGFENGE
ncbi:hypothetical protein N7540_011096 [Penicillium herquei]|nr:hypothetical protein N7540_011096 [Penicillium herquei]